MLETQKLLSAIKPLMGFSNFFSFIMFRIKNDGIFLSKNMTILSVALLLIITVYKLWIMSEYSFSVYLEAVLKVADISFFTFVILSHLNYAIHGKSIVKNWNNMIKYASFIRNESYYKRIFRITCLQVSVVHGSILLHILTSYFSPSNLNILHQSLLMLCNHLLLSHFLGTTILFGNSLHFGRKIISLVNEELETLRCIERYKNIPPVSGVAFVKREEIERLRSTMKMMENENVFTLIDVYEGICGLCLDLNDLFGVSLTVSWFYELMVLVLYCFIMTVVNSSMILVFLFWIFYHLVCNWMLLNSCERFTKEAMRTGLLLNSLTTENSSTVLKEAVQRFSLNLLHRKIKFTACNLFDLDYKFFYSALSSIITYFVIFVQFNRDSS